METLPTKNQSNTTRQAERIWQRWKQESEVRKLEMNRAIAAYNRSVEREVLAEQEYRRLSHGKASTNREDLHRKQA